MFIRHLFSAAAATCLCLSLSLTNLHAKETAPDDHIIGASGLPLPRFVSLKFNEVNTRNGPGKRYPIRWVYKQKSLTVEIVEEFDHWRKIKDLNNDGGWVHESQLSGIRTTITTQKTALRDSAKRDARPLIRIGENVLGRIIACELDWCHLKIDNYKGWLPKKELWGVHSHEVIDD